MTKPLPKALLLLPLATTVPTAVARSWATFSASPAAAAGGLAVLSLMVATPLVLPCPRATTAVTADPAAMPSSSIRAAPPRIRRRAGLGPVSAEAGGHAGGAPPAQPGHGPLDACAVAVGCQIGAGWASGAGAGTASGAGPGSSPAGGASGSSGCGTVGCSGCCGVGSVMRGGIL